MSTCIATNQWSMNICTLMTSIISTFTAPMTHQANHTHTHIGTKKWSTAIRTIQTSIIAMTTEDNCAA